MTSKEYFDQVAGEWDHIRKTFFSEAVREKAFRVAGVESGKLAADIGAGTGFITEGLIQRDVRVIAVDPSVAMLAEMRKKFERAHTIDFRCGDAERLPIEDEAVDYVFANMCLHHVESPPEAIKEMVRILRKGGKLVITDLDEHDFEFLLREQHDRWPGFRREEVQGWFEDAGLREVVVDCVGESCCSPSESGNDFAEISIFVASGVK
jgi:ubiquinone/menaquinone biosynthesis C-methylase UbiE